MKVKVRQVIKTIIEQKRCPQHGERPAVDTSAREIRIHACCPTFHVACVSHINSVLTAIDVSSYWKVA